MLGQLRDLLGDRQVVVDARVRADELRHLLDGQALVLRHGDVADVLAEDLRLLAHHEVLQEVDGDAVCDENIKFILSIDRWVGAPTRSGLDAVAPPFEWHIVEHSKNPLVEEPRLRRNTSTSGHLMAAAEHRLKGHLP